MSVYRQLVRAGERARAERGLSVRALSALTWTSEDRRAWDDTYRASICVAASRTLMGQRERSVAEYWRDPVSLRYRDARAAIGDVRYSVHVDCMQGEGQ